MNTFFLTQTRRVLLTLLLLLPGLLACDKGMNYTIGLEIVTPENQDVLAGVSSLTLTLHHTTKDKSKTLNAPIKADGSIDLGFGDLPDWTEFYITAEATGDAGALFGKTMPIAPSRDAGATFGLFLSIPDTIAVSPERLEYERSLPATTMLNNYDLLVVGGVERNAEGQDQSTPSTIEWFNGGTWLLSELSLSGQAVSTPKGMVGHTLTASGAVRAVFGFGHHRVGDSEGLEELYLFDAGNPSAPLSILERPSKAVKRSQAAMTPLLDGSLVLFGGGRDDSGKPLDDLWLIDVTNTTITELGTLKQARYGHRFLPLSRSDGEGESEFLGVLLVGGNDEGEALSFLSFAGLDQGAAQVSFSEEVISSDLPSLRDFATANLGDGVILLAGGESPEGPSAASWRIGLKDDGSFSILRLTDLPQAVSRLCGVAVSQDSALFCGGRLADQSTSDQCLLLADDDVASNKRKRLRDEASTDGDEESDEPNDDDSDGDREEENGLDDGDPTEASDNLHLLSSPRSDCAMERLGDGLVLILGGWNEENGSLRDVDVYTPSIEQRR